MKRILLAAVIAVMPLTAVAQDFDRGLTAYEAGDYATAINELRPLAEQGHAKAQYNLGYMYYYGKGVSRDSTEAGRWYRLAADQGYAPAQTELGLLYLHRFGVPKDYGEAMRWFRLAADQDYAHAQHVIGSMYYYGNGVSRDFAEAARWYRLAAKQGMWAAQFLLGQMYREGRGVLQDFSTAHMWFNIASATFGDEVGARDKIAEKMTQEQIAEAQRRARVCMGSNYKDCD